MTHTLGPLTIIKDPQIDGVDYAIMSEDTLLIGEAYGQAGSTTDSFTMPARANALLWSVAPEMLETLEGLGAALMVMEDLDQAAYDTLDDYLSENIIDLRKVITKARGRTPKKEQ